VERSMFFGYNGTLVDGSGQPEAYGESPPSISVTMLGGPLTDADGIANPRYDNLGHQLCDASVNGTGFGDTVADNERYGLQRFMYFNNSNSGVPVYMQDPAYYPQYYLLMQGYWNDSTRLYYGGNGHPNAGGYGPDCNFMFPGESDTLDWGVGCQPPNGPKNWTEETAGNNPSDRRGMGSAGPFTFKPGDVQSLDLAYVWARAYGANDPQASVEKLRQMNDIISSAYISGILPNGAAFFYGVPEETGRSSIQIKAWPNPVRDIIHVAFTAESSNEAVIEILNSQGQTVMVRSVSGVHEVTLNLSALPSGLYLVRVSTGSGSGTQKLIKN
jgi:hypothetical protein